MFAVTVELKWQHPGAFAMADDPNVVSKSTILQSITTEAGGFYTTITTVASTFLGASLLFADKFLTAGNAFALAALAVSWIALVSSIAFVAHVRFLNLKSGQLALQEKFDASDAIDKKGGKCSTLAQWCLIVGMAALVAVGLANVNNLGKKEGTTMNNPNSNASQNLGKTIPYGSLKPNSAPVQAPAQTSPAAPVSAPPPASQPKQ
jgi:hypothetical protein